MIADVVVRLLPSLALAVLFLIRVLQLREIFLALFEDVFDLPELIQLVLLVFSCDVLYLHLCSKVLVEIKMIRWKEN